MTTYYVAKWGNNSNNGLSGSGAYLTIDKALQTALTDGDTVEIIDEGTYGEGDLGINADNLTLKHTASWLGRAVLDAEGIDANEALRTFDVAGANVTYIGLEITGYGLGESDGCVIQKGGGAPGSSIYHQFHMSGCFIHNCSALGSNYFINNNASDPSTLKQCIMFIDPYHVYNCIDNTGYMEISNCLITSSTAKNFVINDSGKLTASFSTFINRYSSTKPIVKAGKVINCIITGSASGIASNDHTFNVVDVTLIPYLELDGETLGTTGSGELTPGTAIEFLNGGSVGNEESIAFNYRLQETSPAIDAGQPYDGIAVDLTGTSRPQGPTNGFDMGCYEYISIPPEWTTYPPQEYLNLSSDFTINNYKNISSGYKFKFSSTVRTIPLLFGLKGPMSIRNRNKPYKIDK